MPYLGRQPGVGVRNRYIYTATASQTTFSGADDNGATLAYDDAAYVDVYLNGVLLIPVTDYAATTKTSIVLTSGAAVSDLVEILAYEIASIADTVSKANGGTFAGPITVEGAFTSQGIDDNANATAITIDSSENVLIGKTSTSTSVAGIGLFDGGLGTFTRSSAQPLDINRQTDDGDIILFRKDGTSVGSIGTQYATLNIDGGSGASGIHFAAASLTPRDNGAYTDAGIDLGTATYRFRNAHLSGGVVFGDAGGSGTPTSNTLDSYEEGTWTPACSTGTLTYANASYTKIGRLVTVSAAVGAFSDTTSSSAVSITGLPFTSSSAQIAAGAIFARYISKTETNAAFVSDSVSNLTFYPVTSGNWTALKHSEIVNSSAYIYFSVTYFTS